MKKTMVLALAGALLLSFAGQAAWAADAKQMEANKKVILDFYEKAINKKDFEAASVYFGNRYTQHNPMAANGPEGLRDFLAYMKGTMPKAKAKIKKVFADGDYVILHVHFIPKPGAKGSAVVDIFKLENGKVVEHWDVIQEIPEKPANSNTMF